MEKIAILLNLLQSYSHNAHNLVKGPLFLQDHDFLGELYEGYQDDYDDVIERAIGLNIPISLNKIRLEAVQMLTKLPESEQENKNYLKNILSLEKNLCQTIEEYLASNPVSEGTKQLLGEICNKSEKRQYKIQQRIK